MAIKVNIGDKLINILSYNALVAGGGECRRLFAVGGISLNGEKISDSNKTLDKDDFRDGEAIVQVGRKKSATLVCA